MSRYTEYVLNKYQVHINCSNSYIFHHSYMDYPEKLSSFLSHVTAETTNSEWDKVSLSNFHPEYIICLKHFFV